MPEFQGDTGTLEDRLLRRRQVVESWIVAKVRADPSFRKALVSQPKQTLQDALGLEFPAAVSIHVHEETDTHLHIVLPVSIITSEELSDDIMATVVGGSGASQLGGLTSLTTVDWKR